MTSRRPLPSLARRALPAFCAFAALASAGCSALPALPSPPPLPTISLPTPSLPTPSVPAPPLVPSPMAGRAPTTEVSNALGPRERLDAHASRLADGVARYREVSGGGMPQSLRDLALTMAADGRPCFTEILKDHWFQPYAYAVVDERAGRFQLASAGQNGQFGDRDDLAAVRGPGDARVETYGFTARAGQ